MLPTSQARWDLVVPLKPTELGKSRLAAYAGPRRPELTRAMVLDTVAAALHSPQVATVLVVTDDSQIAPALAETGINVIPDVPAAGLNAAIRFGFDHLRARRPGSPVAAVTADLPALRAHDLTAALVECAQQGRSFVSDAAGVGTTLLATTLAEDRAHVALAPEFGAGSRAAHLRSGATEITLAVPSLRRDVDTEADLSAALRLGVGPRTRVMLGELNPLA
jgi:2-phospho-L-lactate/phosphoenolpyruvate guanylyltransferase